MCYQILRKFPELSKIEKIIHPIHFFNSLLRCIANPCCACRRCTRGGVGLPGGKARPGLYCLGGGGGGVPMRWGGGSFSAATYLPALFSSLFPCICQHRTAKFQMILNCSENSCKCQYTTSGNYLRFPVILAILCRWMMCKISTARP